jgi:hypothetical protein
MAFTQSQYDALCAAIASGAKQVMYGNKLVMYNSLADMLNVKKMMEKDLGIGAIDKAPGRKFGSFDKGLL